MDSPHTSTGSGPRRARRTETASGRAWRVATILVLALAGASSHAAQTKLLPADEAFRFGARALDSRTVEARFSISEGYYLYRDKLRFVATPSFGFVPAPLPRGELKDDEFFGRVETYRGEVSVRIALPEALPGASVSIEAESQGCAEVGVCYPPNRQRVTLELPASAAAAGPFVEANPAKKSWFK